MPSQLDSHSCRAPSPAELLGYAGGMRCSTGTGLTWSGSRVEVSAGFTGFEPCRGQEGSATDFGWVHGTAKDSCTVWTGMQMLIPNLLPKTSEVFGSRVLAWSCP